MRNDSHKVGCRDGYLTLPGVNGRLSGRDAVGMSCHYQCEDDGHGLAVIEVEIQPADQGVAQNHWGYAWREGVLTVAAGFGTTIMRV